MSRSEPEFWTVHPAADVVESSPSLDVQITAEFGRAGYSVHSLARALNWPTDLKLSVLSALESPPIEHEHEG